MMHPAPRRYLVVETAISVAINTLIGVVPALLSLAAADPVPTRSLYDVNLSLTPPCLMGALMSALVPSLLTRRRQTRGEWRHARQDIRPTIVRIGGIAVLLAILFMLFATSIIQFALPFATGDRLGSLGVAALTVVQGALSGAVVTPLALTVLFGLR